MIPIKLILLLLAAVGSMIGGVHAAFFGPRAKTRKRLRNATRELVEGAVVTLTGTVRAKGDLVTGPLSGREGVAFLASARIYGPATHHMRSRPIVDHVQRQEAHEFVLETKDGPIEIEPGEALIEYTPEPLIPRKIEREQAFLRAAGSNVHAKDAGFDEVVIQPGMKISVLGAVHFEVAPGDGGYRETGRRVILSAPPDHPVTITRPI